MEKKTHINRAYLIMVALDENENPTQVPGLLCDTEEEKEEFEAGKRRASLRKGAEKKLLSVSSRCGQNSAKRNSEKGL